MNSKRLSGIAAISGFIVLTAWAESPNFIPDTTFKASSLAGWHSLGQADWSAQNGELAGKAKPGGNGGWLVLDKSYQDIGFFASFHCTGECKTGVLLRAEKTADGMKGLYVSLTGEDLSLNRVTLDPEGKELTREKLQPVAEMVRFAAPVTGGGGGGRRGPGLRRDDWNTVQIILDSDILRGSVNNAAGRTTGATGDNREGFGPVALYVGPSSEVKFKDVAFKDLMPKSEPKEQ